MNNELPNEEEDTKDPQTKENQRILMDGDRGKEHIGETSDSQPEVSHYPKSDFISEHRQKIYDEYVADLEHINRSYQISMVAVTERYHKQLELLDMLSLNRTAPLPPYYPPPELSFAPDHTPVKKYSSRFPDMSVELNKPLSVVKTATTTEISPEPEDDEEEIDLDFDTTDYGKLSDTSDQESLPEDSEESSGPEPTEEEPEQGEAYPQLTPGQRKVLSSLTSYGSPATPRILTQAIAKAENRSISEAAVDEKLQELAEIRYREEPLVKVIYEKSQGLTIPVYQLPTWNMNTQVVAKSESHYILSKSRSMKSRVRNRNPNKRISNTSPGSTHTLSSKNTLTHHSKQPPKSDFIPISERRAQRNKNRNQAQTKPNYSQSPGESYQEADIDATLHLDTETLGSTSESLEDILGVKTSYRSTKNER